jgi:histidyl-tRNA synthetase
LYGLAQGNEDTKEYSLHFDLTVPFARYVLDRENDITFPFKRYQIQPVRRGERSQRGRFKEFWQSDIDVIRQETDK